MEWISEHFQLVVLVLGAFAYWLKAFIEQRVAEKQARAAPQQPQEPEAEDDFKPEGPMKYGEMPPSLPVPPVLLVPPAFPSERLPGYEEVAAREAATAARHREKLSAHLQRLRDTKATTTGGAAATRSRISAARNALTGEGAKVSDVTVTATLRSRLRDPAEIRRAMVLKEILGQPVSLRLGD